MTRAKPSAGAGLEPAQLDLLAPVGVMKAVAARLAILSPEVTAAFNHNDFGLDALENNSEARGPGRPKGSPNKTTKDFRKYLIERFGHPLVGTAMLGSWRSMEEFIAKVTYVSQALGVSKEKAADICLACNGRIAPYVEGAMPIRVDARVAAGVHIQFAPGNFDMPAANAAPPIEAKAG